MRFAHAPILIALFVVLGHAQPPLPATDDLGSSVVIEDVYLARDDGAGKVGEITDKFSPSDIPIHCVVVLVKADPVTVKMELVAVNVAGVKPGSRVISASYDTKQGHDRVYFTGKPEGKWVTGVYRIDIFVSGKREGSVTFDVNGATVPQAASQFTASPKPRSKPVKKPRKQ